MFRLIFFFFPYFFISSASAITTIEEASFLKAVSSYGRNATTGGWAEKEIFNTIDYLLIDSLSVQKCNSYLNYENPNRIAKIKYFSALKNALEDINSLAVSDLVPINAKSFSDLVWLTAYRNAALKNNTEIISFTQKINDLKFKELINLYTLNNLYQDVRYSAADTLRANLLNDFRAVLENSNLLVSAKTSAQEKGYEIEFSRFISYTNASYEASNHNETELLFLDNFFNTYWKDISTNLLKKLDTKDQNESVNFFDSYIFKSAIKTFIELSDNKILLDVADSVKDKSNNYRYNPAHKLIITNKSIKIDTKKILTLLYQKEYTNLIEESFFSDIPTLKERVSLKNMLKAIIHKHASSICE